MNLKKKKQMISRALNVGVKRIVFNTNSLADIKEIITKQDAKDMLESGAIMIREIKGRKAIVKRKQRRRAGSIKKKVKGKKREYITLTRKLRKYIELLRKTGKISAESRTKLRKEIRAKIFRSLSHMKERLSEVSK